MSAMNSKRFAVGLLRGAALLLAIATASIAAQAQVSGAIWTTTASGTVVDGNIYALKADVYLNGGPKNAKCSAAGLQPDGDYYFQVTDPSGAVLLSTDDISSRKVHVSSLGVIDLSYSHATGFPGLDSCGSVTVQLAPFDFTPNPGGEYKAWMAPVNTVDVSGVTGTFGFPNSASKTDNFKVKEKGCTENCNPPTSIVGVKFYDLNTNGQLDSGEVLIPGWRIEMTDSSTNVQARVTCTNAVGSYGFLVDPADAPFTISEVLPNTTWIATTPTSGTLSSVNQGQANAGPNFGNVCVGAGGGLTLGFWSNKNGQLVMGTSMAADLALLSSLNLRNANGSDFDPSSYSGFRTWLLNATATNMAYMLSAQLAAMELNVKHNFVNGARLIYAPGTNSANSNGFASVSAVMAEANSELGLHGTAFDGDSWRSYQEALKNALDRANNNRTFVQPGPCDFTISCF